MPFSERFPRPLLVGAGLLLLNSIILIFWWIAFPANVPSNGAQVFFILLWLGAAWGLLLGEGWIRVGIVLLLVAFVWGLHNQPSILIGLSKINAADILSKLVALVAVVLFYFPKSREFFKSHREPATE